MSWIETTIPRDTDDQGRPVRVPVETVRAWVLRVDTTPVGRIHKSFRTLAVVFPEVAEYVARSPELGELGRHENRNALQGLVEASLASHGLQVRTETP